MRDPRPVVAICLDQSQKFEVGFFGPVSAIFGVPVLDFHLRGRIHLLFGAILAELLFFAFAGDFSVPAILKPFVDLATGEPRTQDELLFLFSGWILVRLLEDFFQLEYGVEGLLAQRHVPVAAPSQIRVALLFRSLHFITIFSILILLIFCTCLFVSTQVWSNLFLLRFGQIMCVGNPWGFFVMSGTGGSLLLLLFLPHGPVPFRRFVAKQLAVISVLNLSLAFAGK